MAEIRYMISDVSKMLNTQASVLRYFEYHLNLNIKRTELGHRYYTQEDIDLLSSVKALKDKGFDLKVIKAVLPYIDKVKSMDQVKMMDMKERLEMALGLCGSEAKESLKSQYGKVIEINMEEARPIAPAAKAETSSGDLQQTLQMPKKEEAVVSSGEIVIGDETKKQMVHDKSEKTEPKEEAKTPVVEVSIKQEDKGKEEKKTNKQTSMSKNVITYKNLTSNTNSKNTNQRTPGSKPMNLKQLNPKQPNNKTTNTISPVIAPVSKEVIKPEESNAVAAKSQAQAAAISEEKVEQFKRLMTAIVSNAIRQNNQSMIQEINDTVTDSVVREMDYMLSLKEAREEQKAEERFRQLDRILRETVNNRQQAAATKENGKKRQSKFFKKNKVRI